MKRKVDHMQNVVCDDRDRVECPGPILSQVFNSPLTLKLFSADICTHTHMHACTHTHVHIHTCTHILPTRSSGTGRVWMLIPASASGTCLLRTGSVGSPDHQPDPFRCSIPFSSPQLLTGQLWLLARTATMGTHSWWIVTLPSGHNSPQQHLRRQRPNSSGVSGL